MHQMAGNTKSVNPKDAIRKPTLKEETFHFRCLFLAQHLVKWHSKICQPQNAKRLLLLPLCDTKRLRRSESSQQHGSHPPTIAGPQTPSLPPQPGVNENQESMLESMLWDQGINGNQESMSRNQYSRNFR